MKSQLRRAIVQAAQRIAGQAAGCAPFTVARPAGADHGDYSTNVALILAKPAGRPPRDLAEDIATELRNDTFLCQQVEVAGRGFLNVTVSRAGLEAAVRQALAQQSAYGRVELLVDQSLCVEFVGRPSHELLTVSAGRAAVFGDVLANVAAAAGANVDRQCCLADSGVATLNRTGVRYDTCSSDRSPGGSESCHGGFDRVLSIHAVEPHERLARVTGSATCAEPRAGRPESLACQGVRLRQGGRQIGDEAQWSMDQLNDEVTADVARFFFLTRSHRCILDFDLDLATRETSESPAYRVQEAHAQAAWVIRQAENGAFDAKAADLALLTRGEEHALIHRVGDLSDEVHLAAQLLEPSRLTRYAQELAAAMHAVQGERAVRTENPELTFARLALIKASGVALRNVLTMLGVTAPDRM